MGRGHKNTKSRSEREVDQEVGQFDESLLEPKSEVETLMVIITGAECSNSRAQPTNINKTKLSSTLKETSSESNIATTEQSSGATKTQSEKSK